MARVTTEDALTQISNRFLLVKLATKRARQLRDGASPTIECKNKENVTALREIETGHVFIDGDVAELERRSIFSE